MGEPNLLKEMEAEKRELINTLRSDLQWEREARESYEEECNHLSERVMKVEHERDELLDIVHEAGVVLYWMLESPYDPKTRQRAFDIEKRISHIIERYE